MMQSKMYEEKENNLININNFSVLNAFDFTAIDEMDPSLSEGHILVFDREAPFELRI